MNNNPRKYLDQLFISKVRIKAMKYFFQNPDRSIHLRGAVREFNEEINAVRRELTRMEEIKLVIAEKRGNRKNFRLNKEFVFFPELLGIVHKTFGLGGEIVTMQKKLGEIDFALLTQKFVYGQAYGTHKVDLVVVGEVDLKQLAGLIEAEEHKLQREIHYTVLSRSDFELRRRRRDSFVVELMVQETLMLIGGKRDFVGANSL